MESDKGWWHESEADGECKPQCRACELRLAKLESRDEETREMLRHDQMTQVNELRALERRVANLERLTQLLQNENGRITQCQERLAKLEAAQSFIAHAERIGPLPTSAMAVPHPEIREPLTDADLAAAGFDVPPPRLPPSPDEVNRLREERDHYRQESRKLSLALQHCQERNKSAIDAIVRHAKEQARAEGRAAVVADLRKESARWASAGGTFHHERDLLNKLADRYERGEHVKKE